MSSGTSNSFHQQPQHQQQAPAIASLSANWLFALLASSCLWTILMTIIPVMIDVPSMYYYKNERNWFSGDDIMRLLEPIGGTMFAITIFSQSGIYKNITSSYFDNFLIILFSLSVAVFNQGAGYHSASNMFKHVVETIMTYHDDSKVEGAYYYMRTVWEHLVSHYMYAAGYAIINLCYVIAFRNHVILSTDPSYLGVLATDAEKDKGVNCDTATILVGGRHTNIIIWTAAFLFGLLIAAVAVEFIAGIAIGLIYTTVYGGGMVGVWLAYDIKNNSAFYEYFEVFEDSKSGRHDSYNAYDGGGGSILGLEVPNFSLIKNEMITTSKESGISSFEDTSLNAGSNSTQQHTKCLPCMQYLSHILRRAKRRVVVYYFLLSYCIGFWLIILWIIIVGGSKRRDQTGI